MSKIQKVNKQTENKFLNLYDLEAKDRMGGDIHYYVSSRAKTPDDLKINTRNEKPDGVIIYSLYGEKKDRFSGTGWFCCRYGLCDADAVIYPDRGSDLYPTIREPVQK